MNEWLNERANFIFIRLTASPDIGNDDVLLALAGLDLELALRGVGAAVRAADLSEGVRLRDLIAALGTAARPVAVAVTLADGVQITRHISAAT